MVNTEDEERDSYFPRLVEIFSLQQNLLDLTKVFVNLLPTRLPSMSWWSVVVHA